MSNLAQFFGSPVLNAPIASGLIGADIVTLSTGIPGTNGIAGMTSSLVGTSGSLQTVVTYTGQGVLEFCSAQSKNATNTINLVITIDGNVVFNGTTNATQYSAVCAAGAISLTGIALGAIPFRTSLLIQYQMQTNSANSGLVTYKYRKTA